MIFVIRYGYVPKKQPSDTARSGVVAFHLWQYGKVLSTTYIPPRARCSSVTVVSFFEIESKFIWPFHFLFSWDLGPFLFFLFLLFSPIFFIIYLRAYFLARAAIFFSQRYHLSQRKLFVTKYILATNHKRVNRRNINRVQSIFSSYHLGYSVSEPFKFLRICRTE
jgi:hypothetical protein